MSDEVFNRAGLHVARFVGPEYEGADRARWQFTPVGPDYAVLRRADLEALAEAIDAALACPECGGNDTTGARHERWCPVGNA